MKALVMEINKNNVIVLTEKGDYIKIPSSPNYFLGQEIQLSTGGIIPIKSLQKKYQKIAAIAAVVTMFLSIGGGSYAYYTPYSYVNLDINPSVEITANIFNIILDVKGLNDEGSKIVNSIDLKNSNIQTGIQDVIEKAADFGYLKKDSDNNILLTVSSNDSKTVDKIESVAQKNIIEHVKSKNVQAVVSLDKSDITEFKTAKESGMSPGKYHLIQKLRQANENIKIEDYKSVPVKEINKALNELKNKKSNKDNNKNNNDLIKHQDNKNKIVPTPPMQNNKNQIDMKETEKPNKHFDNRIHDDKPKDNKRDINLNDDRNIHKGINKNSDKNTDNHKFKDKDKNKNDDDVKHNHIKGPNLERFKEEKFKHPRKKSEKD